MSGFDTYPKLLIRNVKLYGDSVALRRKNMGIWKNNTWKDCYGQVKSLCLGLVDLGLRPGDKVALIGDDEPEGFWAEAAIQAAGGVVVAMWSDSIASEVAYIIKHSDSKFVISEDQEQVDKILEIKESIPGVEKVIYWDRKGMRNYDDPMLTSYEEIKKIGLAYDEKYPAAFEALIEEGKGSDVAQISYTSGTTSLPKGVVITHNAIMASARRMQEYAPLEKGEDVITTLASASVFHSWFSGYSYMRGVIINFPEEPETLMHDYREISPRFLLVTPRQWESLSSMTQTRINDAGFLKQFVYNLFLPVGYKVTDLSTSKKKIGYPLRILNKLGDLLVFAPIRDKLGLTKTKYPITGSAFLSPDFFRYYQAIGINLRQIYGSTEAGVVSMHSGDEIDNDSVGKLCDGVEVKISEDQEILVRGESIFTEYYKDPEKTDQVIKNGWFHTGDSGYINDRNHLFYLDRIENLDELNNGHKYAPAYIEGKLKFSRFIQDVMVVGGKNRSYLSVIINIDFESIGKWAESNRLTYTTFVDLSQKKEVGSLIKNDLERVNNTLPKESKVRKFVLLHKEFDADEGELTRTRKLKRQFLQVRYKDLIDAVYENKKEIPIVTEVKYRDGRKGNVETNLKIHSVYEDGVPG